MKIQGPLTLLQSETITQTLRGKGNNESISEFKKEFVDNSTSPALELTKEYLGQFLDVNG
jgi:hypothetical protein